MLNHLKKLSFDTDGRYAADFELQFLIDYLKSYPLRLSAYQKLQAAEVQIVRQVEAKVRSQDPSLLMGNQGDLTAKWRRDTVRVLRYSSCALLIDDAQYLQETLLLWMQTIMRSFGAQPSCNATYAIMQDVVRQYLTPGEAELFCPILELNRVVLGTVS